MRNEFTPFVERDGPWYIVYGPPGQNHGILLGTKGWAP